MGHVHRRWIGVDHDSDLLGALSITDSDCQSMLENVRNSSMGHWTCATVRHSTTLYSPKATPKTCPGSLTFSL